VETLLSNIGDIIQNQAWLAFPACFLGGIISSASPCVLAMIPLVIGFVAGAMGRLFGDVGSFWNYVLPPVAILLGLQLLGVFKFNIGISQRFLPKRKALLGAFLMGLFFGIVASPCATPVLAVILTFAATQQEIAYSGGLLLAYALGHWVLVVGAGISTGFAQRVIQSKGISNFSNYSKKVSGVLLIGVGIYLLTSLL